MTGIFLIAPLLLLSLGAGVVVASGNRAAGLGGRLPAALASLALVAGLPLLILPPCRLVLSRWTMDSLPPLALSLQSDALSTPFLLVILLVTAVGFSIFDLQSLIDSSKSERRQPAALLLLAAAGAAFVLAGDPLTLYVVWVLIDLAIFAVVYSQTAQTDLDQPIRSLGVNTVLGLPLLIAAVTAAPGMGWAHGSGQGWPALVVVALLVAAGARLGVYPAPFRFPSAHPQGAFGQAFLELISVPCGAYLFLRVLLLAEGIVPLGSIWVWVAALAIAAGGVLAWSDDARAAVSWVVVTQAGLLLLTFGLPDLARAVALLQAFTLCLAPALLYLVLDVQPTTRRGLLWVRGLGWLAVANLLGVPPTLGFVARWALYRQLLEGERGFLVILLAAATGLTVPPLLRLMSAEGQDRAGQASSAPLHLSASAQVVGVSLVGLVLLVIGLQPLLLLPALQMLMGAASAYLGQVIRGVSSMVGLEVVLALALPILAGYGLASFSPGRAQMDLLQRLQRGLSLRWTYGVVERAAWRLGTMLRSLTVLLEGESYWGWTFLFALLVALVVLSG